MFFSVQGYSTSKAYKVRAKCYPSRDLQIVLHEQEDEDTCSAASAKMVLSYYGINLSESTIETWMRNNNSSWNIAGNVSAVINHYLSLNNKNVNYVAEWSGSLSEEGYKERLINNICSGYPVIPLITVNNKTYFEQTTGGHYIVVKGIYYDFSSNIYRTKINDPFYQYSKVYTSMPLTGLYECNMAHPHDFMIFVVH